MHKIFKGIHRRILNFWLNLYMPLLSHFGKKSGLYNGNERKEKIIVSLTTFPSRIDTVHLMIETILRQTMKPNEIHLYLAESEFPSKILPQSLERLKLRGLSIFFCENLRSHKKYYYAIKNNPDAIIITVDDDFYYPRKLIENLMEKHLEFPNAVVSSWIYNVHPLKFIAGSGSGTLFPPHCLPQEAFNKKTIVELCPLADDIWLKVMEILNNVPVVKAKIDLKYLYVKNSHKKNALYFINTFQGENKKQIQNLLQHYKINLEEK